jgi:membrane protein YdbS with pleckstrin-like domain
VPISRRLLDDDEEVLVDVRPHWEFLAGPAVLTGVAVGVAVTVVVEFPGAPIGVAGVLAAMIALPTVWLAGRTVRWLSIGLAVTSTRIILRQGVFSRDVLQVRLQRVVEVHCHQTLIDRLIGSGRLVLELVDDRPFAVNDVRRPRRLQRVIDRQRDEAAHGGRYGPSVAVGVPTDPAGPFSTRALDLADTPPHGVTATSTLPVATWPAESVPTPAHLSLPAPTVPPRIGRAVTSGRRRGRVRGWHLTFHSRAGQPARRSPASGHRL